MKNKANIILLAIAVVLTFSCKKEQTKEQLMQSQKSISAKDILGNSEYLAISYGAYRTNSRKTQPTIPEIKEDLKIMAAMGIKILRTYNVHFPHAENILKAISELKKEGSDFEMYVMLGAWIEAKHAFTDVTEKIRNQDGERYMPQIDKMIGNEAEMKEAIRLTKQYPNIVKILAVGNEAMVHWATEYFVEPAIILKWVNHLQQLKNKGELPKDLWITSSDNFAAWGGGDLVYHKEDLVKLIKAVDYISMHTYAYHDTHYSPDYWVNDTTTYDTDLQKIEAAMLRAKMYAKSQYNGVKSFIDGLGIDKPIHIGESGWATQSNGLYGSNGSKATDEYKAALYYKHLREWTNEAGISCFYFEAFDENWKDAGNPGGSENHFGLFTLDGKAKYALWDLVDKGVFDGLIRNGKPITKTYNGNKEELMKDVLVPNIKAEVINN
ncbi:glycosyl hydrolase family 17 protein [Flavobacteriaceae bacterium S0825]|uniref:glycosyl hydrolase family 17 protein n=1 Tax=Gaetbulibacter sp. S0825 TaxID=2720084 RepID=UPI001431570B|nr:glycosyl hydrolase family 17 protein [Gaetbulibacter sp. S0825]MCK0110002.1 glycosyl hydrolase family 17 protein [Flavobacteriaceae bacterium S0825]NIX65631.1 glycosyl hydrolase family 17 [Gaetbulibacter sp. S0825]